MDKLYQLEGSVPVLHLPVVKWVKLRHPLPRLLRDPRAAATDIYQRVRSWKVDDVGNAGVFDSARLGAEADVFLRAPLILCPPPPFKLGLHHFGVPFQSQSSLCDSLTPPSCPPPSALRRLTTPALPWQPFSSHSNLSYQGTRPWGSGAGTHLPPPTRGFLARRGRDLNLFCISPPREEIGTQEVKDRKPVFNMLQQFFFVFFVFTVVRPPPHWHPSHSRSRSRISAARWQRGQLP